MRSKPIYFLLIVFRIAQHLKVSSGWFTMTQEKISKKEALTIFQSIIDFIKRNLEVSLSLEEARNRLEAFSFLNASLLDQNLSKDPEAAKRYMELLTPEQHESMDKLLTEAIGEEP